MAQLIHMGSDFTLHGVWIPYLKGLFMIEKSSLIVEILNIFYFLFLYCNRLRERPDTKGNKCPFLP